MSRFERSIQIPFFLGTLAACSGQTGPQTSPNTDSSYVDEHGTAHVTRVVPVPETISPEAQKWLAQPRSDVDPALRMTVLET